MRALNPKNHFKGLVIQVMCWLVIFSVAAQQDNRFRETNIPELAAYNFGSMGELTPSEQIALLIKTGYKGIILNSETNKDSLQLDMFLNELNERNDFRIHAVMVRYNFSDPLLKKEGWKKIANKIADKGVELWFIFGKATEGITDDFIETKLREVLEYSKIRNVKVILYPHSKCYLSSAEEALPFVERINDPDLKLAVHLCHEIRAGNGSRMNDIFERVKNYIGAVTVAGTDSVADTSKPLLYDKSTIKPIGQGNYNIQNFIQPLRMSGYKGMVGFINFKIEDIPEVYLENSMTAWRKNNMEINTYYK